MSFWKGDWLVGRNRAKPRKQVHWSASLIPRPDFLMASYCVGVVHLPPLKISMRFR